jgi:hypothetical protein
MGRMILMKRKAGLQQTKKKTIEMNTENWDMMITGYSCVV